MWSLDRKDHKIHSVEERGDAKSQCVLKFGMEFSASWPEYGSSNPAVIRLGGRVYIEIYQWGKSRLVRSSNPAVIWLVASI